MFILKQYKHRRRELSLLNTYVIDATCLCTAVYYRDVDICALVISVSATFSGSVRIGDGVVCEKELHKYTPSGFH